MRVGARTDIGRVRTNNEDAYCVAPRLLAVADGMGGIDGGEIASRMVIDFLRDYPFTEKDPGEGLVNAIRLANRQIFHTAVEKKLEGMGTTITAVRIEDDQVYFGHVGDSRGYLIRDGQIRQLTSDHSLVGELIRKGSLSPEEAQQHPHRHLLTRALGTSPEVEVETLALSLRLDDALLLCTDGLTAVASDEEILQVIMKNEDPQRAAEALVNLANQRGGPDNITVVVAYFLPPFQYTERSMEDTLELEGLWEEIQRIENQVELVR